MPQILLVNEDRDLLEFLTYALDKKDYTVLHATSYLEAMEIAQDVRPPLILIHNIDSLDSKQALCKQLRENPATQDSCILCLCTTPTPFEGADACINIPLTPKSLLKQIDLHTRQKYTIPLN